MVCCVFSFTTYKNRDHTSNFAIVWKNVVIETELNEDKEIWSDDMPGNFLKKAGILSYPTALSLRDIIVQRISL